MRKFSDFYGKINHGNGSRGLFLTPHIFLFLTFKDITYWHNKTLELADFFSIKDEQEE